MLKSSKLLAALAALTAPSLSIAAPVTFFGEDTTNNGAALPSTPKATAARNQFFSNLTGVGTETFEGFATGASPPIVVNFGTAGKATLTGTGSVQSGRSATNQFPISGSKYYNTNGTFGLAFSTPISAFGFFGTDIGDVNASLTLTLVGSNGTTTQVVPDVIGSSANGSALYYGFYDTAATYTSISFAGAGQDIFGFDDFSIGTRAQVVPSPVPEPAAWAIFGMGLLGMGMVRRVRS